MKTAHPHRKLIAWLLYSCVLFSTFACAIGHGQSSGLQLSGISTLQCSVGGDTRHAPNSPSQPLASFDCPLCSSYALTTSLNGYSLQLPNWQASALRADNGSTRPHLANFWFAASPRAPPVL